MNKKTLFIVEGENDEPNYLKQLFQICFPDSWGEYSFYVYKTNIHQLPSLIMTNGVIDEDIELLQALKSNETNDEAREILSQKYTDVWMIFDFDPQDPNHEFASIHAMLKYYTDSTDMGKLFINYPMMQSYRHLTTLPDPAFFTRTADHADALHYKEIVGQESLSELKQLSRYSYETFVSLTVHHLLKAQRILHLGNSLNLDNFEAIDYALLYALQVEEWNHSDRCFVLNTSTLILLEYRPHHFFRHIISHYHDYRLP